MKREDHKDWRQLYRCGVYKDENDPRILILAPRDSEFRQVLIDSGIVGVDPPPEQKDYTIEKPVPGQVLDADSFLAALRDQTTIPPKEKKPKLTDL
jgi:hypothetical protein